MAGVIALRPFDFQNIGAMIAENLGAQRTAKHPGGVYHTHTAKRAWHACLNRYAGR